MLAVTHYAALLAIMPLDFQQSLPIAQVKKISEKKVLMYIRSLPQVMGSCVYVILKVPMTRIFFIVFSG